MPKAINTQRAIAQSVAFDDAGFPVCESNEQAADSRVSYCHINPIIGFSPSDTIENAACVVAFLARVHSCIADTEEQHPAFYDAGTFREKRGLSVVLDSVAKALRYGCVERLEGGAI